MARQQVGLANQRASCSWPGREAAGDITMKRLRTAPGRETRNGDPTFLSARAAEVILAAAIVALFDPPFRFTRIERRRTLRHPPARDPCYGGCDVGSGNDADVLDRRRGPSSG